MDGDPTLSRSLARDWTTAPLGPADRAMLAFVVKLTLTPGEMTRSDAEALKAAGFDDTGVLDVTQVAAYYAYVNRLADDLGVELEEYWTHETLTVSREEFERRKG